MVTEAGWTSNVPANEGEYWFRSDGVRKPIVAHVYLDVEQDLRIIIGINDLYVTDLDGFDEFDGAEFLGPLSPTDRQQGKVEGIQESKNLVSEFIEAWLLSGMVAKLLTPAVHEAVGGLSRDLRRELQKIEQAAQDEKGAGE